MPGNIADVPTSYVLTWPKPDYDHGVRRSWLPVFAIVLLIISSSVACVRTVLRARKQGGGLGLDDVFMLPAWLVLIAFTAVTVRASKRGLIDRHIWDLKIDRYSEDLLNGWIGQFLFVVGTACLKISVLLFYRRMVAGTFKSKWRWAIWTAISFTVLYSLLCVILLLTACHPTEAYWMGFDSTYTKKWKCADEKWSSYLAGICALISDCYSVLLPATLLWSLTLPRRQKLAMYAIFAAGFAIVIAAGFRTDALIRLGTHYDLTWEGWSVYFWSIIEYNLGIVCACAPSLRVLFRKYLKGSIHHSAPIESTPNQSDNTGSSNKQYAIELQHSFTIQSERPHSFRRSKEMEDFDEEATRIMDRSGSFGSTHALRYCDLTHKALHKETYPYDSVAPSSELPANPAHAPTHQTCTRYKSTSSRGSWTSAPMDGMVGGEDNRLHSPSAY